jgi:hypothetical protein
VTYSELSAIDHKVKLGDLAGAVADLLLHVKLLDARIEDLRSEIRTSTTRQAMLNGLGRRK